MTRLLFLLFMLPSILYSQDVLDFRDVSYVKDGHKSQKLDLYIPQKVENPQLLVWVHGGAWRSGDKAKIPIKGLIEKGFALASVNYRLSGEAKFPAQMHDLKASIRFLRANAKKYRYKADKIAIIGSSAGGHLVALQGTTNGHEKLEGKLGEHLDVSSDVQAIVNLYGPTNFMTILKQSTPHGLSVRVPALKLLLGDRPENKKQLALLASPVNHVDKSDPPMLIYHGDQDPQVPINQSHEIHAKYKEHGLKCDFKVVHGGAHGGKGFFHNEQLKEIKIFLDSVLNK